MITGRTITGTSNTVNWRNPFDERVEDGKHNRGNDGVEDCHHHGGPRKDLKGEDDLLHECHVLTKNAWRLANTVTEEVVENQPCEEGHGEARLIQLGQQHLLHSRSWWPAS